MLDATDSSFLHHYNVGLFNKLRWAGNMNQ